MEVYQLLQSASATLSLHPYVFLFIGLFFLGETIFLPALYLVFKGSLPLAPIILLMVTATLLSDLVWYAIGRSLPKTTIARFMGGRAARVMEKVSGFFMGHRLKALYLSKFVYGTRTAMQVLSGMHKMPFEIYMIVNIIGIASLAIFTTILAFITSSTLSALTDTVHVFEVAFLVLIVIVVMIHIFIRRAIERQWFRS